MIEAATSVSLPPASPWTAVSVERLRELWSRDMSASQIAAEIGNISRCAVIGKARRLGLTPRTEWNGGGRNPCVDPIVLEQRRLRNAHLRKARQAAQRGLPPPTDAPAEVFALPAYAGSRNIPFADLGRAECKFIEGESPDHLSCGNPTDGSSWCRHHKEIVWVKPEHRRIASHDANRRGRKVSNFSGSYEAA